MHNCGILIGTEQLVSTFPVSLLRRQPCQLPSCCRNSPHCQPISSVACFCVQIDTLFALNDPALENALGSEL